MTTRKKKGVPGKFEEALNRYLLTQVVLPKCPGKIKMWCYVRQPCKLL